MKKPIENSGPITSDFSPWSMLETGEPVSAKAGIIAAVAILAGFAIFFGIVHYWR